MPLTETLQGVRDQITQTTTGDPYHDPRGRFTHKEDAVSPHGKLAKLVHALGKYGKAAYARTPVTPHPIGNEEGSPRNHHSPGQVRHTYLQEKVKKDLLRFRGGEPLPHLIDPARALALLDDPDIAGHPLVQDARDRFDQFNRSGRLARFSLQEKAVLREQLLAGAAHEAEQRHHFVQTHHGDPAAFRAAVVERYGPNWPGDLIKDTLAQGPFSVVEPGGNEAARAERAPDDIQVKNSTMWTAWRQHLDQVKKTDLRYQAMDPAQRKIFTIRTDKAVAHHIQTLFVQDRQNRAQQIDTDVQANAAKLAHLTPDERRAFYRDALLHGEVVGRETYMLRGVGGHLNEINRGQVIHQGVRLHVLIKPYTGLVEKRGAPTEIRWGVAPGYAAEREHIASEIAHLVGLTLDAPQVEARPAGVDDQGNPVYDSFALFRHDLLRYGIGAHTIPPQEVADAALFDALIGHLDRHSANLSQRVDPVTGMSHQMLHDNEHTFPDHHRIEHTKLEKDSDMMRRGGGNPLTGPQKDALQRVLASEAQIRQQFHTYLPPGTFDGMFDRARWMLAENFIPQDWKSFGGGMHTYVPPMDLPPLSSPSN